MKPSGYDERKAAIHMLRGGQTPAETAAELGRSPAWVYKWQARFRKEGWQGLQDRSRAPRHRPNKLPEQVRSAIRQVRSELEAEADEPDKLSYIGAHAVRARLRKQRIVHVPSISSIERELRTAGLTKSRQSQETPEVQYPHLQPTRPHQLVQVDIVPHYLPGRGGCVSCFNAIDVVSRYPTGKQFLHKRSLDAVAFLTHVWQELGIPAYTQVDNESCFSGGFTHPGVLGKVLRMGLLVGTELVYSPFYHPQSNGTVERFHQEYSHHVWDKRQLPDLEAVHQHSPSFFDLYRQSRHHSALDGHSPIECHRASPAYRLPESFRLPKRLPLTAGKVHFIRPVSETRKITVLNLEWDVPRAKPNQGVWATLEITLRGARLYVYDAAPDAPKRTRLANYPFPLKEPVQPLQAQFQPARPHRRTPLFRSVLQVVARAVSGKPAYRLSTMS
ncbi:MAG: helix-turn-helix domain-containing protein [Anaerolineae bacterium]